MLLPRGLGISQRGPLLSFCFGSILELDYYLIIPSYSNSHPKFEKRCR